MLPSDTTTPDTTPPSDVTDAIPHATAMPRVHAAITVRCNSQSLHTMSMNHVVDVRSLSTGYDPGPSIHVNHPISHNDPGPPIHANIQTITSHVPDTRGPPIPVNIQTITIEDVQPLSANEFSEGFARYPITLAIDYRSRYNQIPFDKESHDLIALDHIPDTRLMLSGYDPGPLMHVNYTLPGYDPGPPIHANVQAITNHVSDTSDYDPGPLTAPRIQTIRNHEPDIRHPIQVHDPGPQAPASIQTITDHKPDVRRTINNHDPGPPTQVNCAIYDYDPGPSAYANVRTISDHIPDLSDDDLRLPIHANIRTITIEDHAHGSHQLMTNANGSRWRPRDLVSVILSWYIVLKTLTDYHAFERSLKTPYFATWKNSMVSLWLPLLLEKSLTITVRKLMERLEFVRLWRGIQKLIQRTFLRKDEIYYLYCWKILRGELEQI